MTYLDESPRTVFEQIPRPLNAHRPSGHHDIPSLRRPLMQALCPACAQNLANHVHLRGPERRRQWCPRYGSHAGCDHVRWDANGCMIRWMRNYTIPSSPCIQSSIHRWPGTSCCQNGTDPCHFGSAAGLHLGLPRAWAASRAERKAPVCVGDAMQSGR